MMKVFIDDEELHLAEESPSKEDILVRTKEVFARKGRLLHSIEVDGAELTEEDFLALSGGEEVRVKGRPIREFLAETLADALVYHGRLVAGLERAADNLEADKTREGLELVGQGAEGIGWLLHVTQNSQILLGANDSEVGDGKLEDLKTSLQKDLAKASDSVESGKTLELAYVIRTSLLPRIESLGNYLAALKDMGDGAIQ